MTTNALFDEIAETLAGFADHANGQFSRARDPFEVLELLGNGPGKFRVILMWQGDEPAGQEPTSGIVESRFVVTVSSNRGLPAIQGGNLSAPPTGGVSLMDWVNDVRCLLRALNISDTGTSHKLRYGGSAAVEYEGARLDAYELRFSIFAALQDETTRVTAYLATL